MNRGSSFITKIIFCSIFSSISSTLISLVSLGQSETFLIVISEKQFFISPKTYVWMLGFLSLILFCLCICMIIAHAFEVAFKLCNVYDKNLFVDDIKRMKKHFELINNLKNFVSLPLKNKYFFGWMILLFLLVVVLFQVYIGCILYSYFTSNDLIEYYNKSKIADFLFASRDTRILFIVLNWILTIYFSIEAILGYARSRYNRG